MSNIKISIRNLTKKFGDKVVLGDINLDIYNNEIITIIGGSGGGKSVFMKVILDLIHKDDGHIFCDNIEITTKSIKKFYKKISVLFQSNALFDSMNIGENIAFPLINQKIDNKNTLIDDALKSVGLNPDIKNLSVSEISGGMQKRVALARTIITKPEIIFLDEPTSGLDVINSRMIFELIKTLAKENKITFFVITHDIFLAPIVSDRIFFIEKGKLRQMTKEDIDEKFKIDN